MSSKSAALRTASGLWFAFFVTALVASGGFPSGTVVSPYLVGQNYWASPPDSAYPVIATSGVRIIRIGGHSPDVTPYSNAAILKQVDNIRSIGAEPLIQVSRNKSATVAANTVQYINVTNGRAVKYWSIGNEPDLDWTGTEPDLATYVAGYTKPIASAMRDIDPTIKICAGDMAWYSASKFKALLGGTADITGKDSQGRYYIDSISFHRYPFNDVFARADVLSEMHSAYESKVSALVSRIAYANALQGRTGADALQWSLTEFNMTFKNPATTINNPEGLGVSSFLNGQLFAEYYRVSMKYGVFATTTWSLLEGGGDGSSTDLGYLGGSWASPVKRSTFYHMQMFANYLLPGGYLPSTSASANLAVVSTSTAAQSQLAVMLLNEDTTGSQTFTLRMNDEPVVGTGTAINISAGLAQEYTGVIENQSTIVLLFDSAGALVQQVTYSLAHDQQNLAPSVIVPPSNAIVAISVQ